MNDEVQLVFLFKGIINSSAQPPSADGSKVNLLALCGKFERTPILNTYRIPGWSVQDFIKENAARAPGEKSIDFLSVGSLIRIPGWAIIQIHRGELFVDVGW